MTQLEHTYMERMPRLLYQLVEELALLRKEMEELRAELKDFEKK
jgi:hypothetical protein